MFHLLDGDQVPRWSLGEQILWCYQREARPVTVIADDPDRGLAVWLAPGTPYLVAVPEDGREVRDHPLATRFVVPRRFAVRRWQGVGIVMIAPPNAGHSLWRFQRDDGTLAGWYGNLETPHQRSSGAAHSADLHLDVWLDAVTGPLWKDEDELAIAVELGQIEAGLVDTLYQEGRRVIAAHRRGEWPFDGSWDGWRPDRTWPVASLPAWVAALAGRPAQPLLTVLD